MIFTFFFLTHFWFFIILKAISKQRFAFSILAGLVQICLSLGCLLLFLFAVCGGISPDWDHVCHALKLWCKGSMEQDAPLGWIPLGPGCDAPQVMDLSPSLGTELGRGSATCATGRRGGWWKQLSPAQESQQDRNTQNIWVGPERSPLAASADSWIVCWWKGEHKNSASLWNFLHRISFTLRQSALEKDQEYTFSTIKACSQMPSCGNLHTHDYGNYPVVERCWTNGQMAKLLPPSLTVFYLILQIIEEFWEHLEVDMGKGSPSLLNWPASKIRKHLAQHIQTWR